MPWTVIRWVGAGEHPAGLGHHGRQDAELPAGARDGLAGCPPYLVPEGVHRDRSHPQDPVGRWRGALDAAQQGSDSGHQLAWTVGLGHVVVGTEVEAEEQVVLTGPGGQHQDRHGRFLAQDPAHIESVDVRHHHIEDEQVRLPSADGVDRRAPVVHDDRAVPLGLQVHPQHLCLPGVVFRDQDPCTHDGDYKQGLRSGSPF